MSSFIYMFLAGKKGNNIGLPTGLSNLDKAINGIQRRTVIGIAAPPKVGKSKLTDAHFILFPWLLAPNEDIEWIYFSYEMDRVQKEFAFAVFFLNYDYQIENYTWKGKKYELTTDYLMGRLKDDTHQPIIVSPEIEEKLKIVYINRIIPLFGEYNDEGKKIKKGKIDFIEVKRTSIEMTNYMINYAKQNGKVVYTEDGKLVGYIPNNPRKFTIIITDTVRKIKLSKGNDNKKEVDTWISETILLRNLCQFTFIHIIHTNRSLSSIDRLKYNNEYIYPTGDDIKDKHKKIFLSGRILRRKIVFLQKI